MPAAAAAAVAALFTSAAAAAVAYAVTYAVVFLAMSFAIGSLMGAIFKPRSQNGFAAEAQGRTQVVRSNVQPRNIIYGRAMTSGPLVFAGSTDGEKKNQFMHLVVALADHECDAIEEVYLGEEAVGPLDAAGNATSGRYMKSWTDPRTYYSAVAPGQTTFTLAPGVPISRVISVRAAGGFSEDFQMYPGYDFTPGGMTVTVTGLDPNTTELYLDYETPVGRSLVRIKKHLGLVRAVGGQRYGRRARQPRLDVGSPA